MTKQFLVLDQYQVNCRSGPEGSFGDINHIGAKHITPVGYFLAFQEESRELRPKHWTVQLFIRMGLRYDETRRTTDPIMDLLSPEWPGWHPDLASEIGELLLREHLATEPMDVGVSRYQERCGTQFGRTWIEDADETFGE